jgi:DNA-binding CsgD family transcriptional regulator
MRRLILEATQKELTKVGVELPQFKKIKSLEFLYFLRQDPEEFAAIAEVEFKDATAKVEDLLGGGYLVEVQALERKKNGACIVFIRGGHSLSSVLDFIGIQGGYLFTPLGIGDGKVKICFLGSEVQVKEFLERINILQIHYRIVLLTDTNFSLISPLSQLTEKQREVLIAAYKFGYYEIPRKITSEELARKLNLVDSTVVEHLRKAEQRLITHIIEQ